MSDLHSNAFQLIGVIHLLPLPGAPAGSPGFEAVMHRAVADAQTLVDGGIHCAILENFGDAPFCAGRVPPHVPAMMGVIGAQIRSQTGLDLGINVLRNDAHAALAVASACGASFVRVNVHVGAAWTDQGLIEGQAYDSLGYRRQLGCDVRIAADVLVKHAVPAGQCDLKEVAKETAYRGHADVLVVTGAHTGGVTSIDDIRVAKRAVPDRPVWVGSGVTPNSLPQLQEVADGVIVGTFLHRDSALAHPLDKVRVQTLVNALK